MSRALSIHSCHRCEVSGPESVSVKGNTHRVKIMRAVINTCRPNSFFNKQQLGISLTATSKRSFRVSVCFLHIVNREFWCRIHLWFRLMGGSASKVDDVTALPSRHKMADMCYYGNVMTTTRWWLYVTILHLEQYSHRLNFFSPPSRPQYSKFPLISCANRYESLTSTTLRPSSLARTNLICYKIMLFQRRFFRQPLRIDNS